MSACRYYPRHPAFPHIFPADEVRYYADAYESGCSTIIMGHGVSDCALMIPGTFNEEEANERQQHTPRR